MQDARFSEAGWKLVRGLRTCFFLAFGLWFGSNLARLAGQSHIVQWRSRSVPSLMQGSMRYRAQILIYLELRMIAAGPKHAAEPQDHPPPLKPHSYYFASPRADRFWIIYKG